MFEKKYHPGDPCSFEFERAKFVTIDDVEVVVFWARRIEFVKGTIPDRTGVLPVYENYCGKVLLKKESINDWGLYEWRRYFTFTKKTKKLKLPKTGRYSEYGKTNLHLDIDEKGRVWLTSKTFYEIKLFQTLSDLKLQLNNIKTRIREVVEEIQEFEESENYAAMGRQFEIDKGVAEDRYDSSLGEESSNDEINRMNEETDGFWDVD